MPHTITREMRQCIDECLSCHAICEETVRHCLELGGRHADPQHLTTLLDCAEICQTSANFMLRSSDQHSRVCGVCAEVCRACDESCRAMGDDENMRKCADACGRCADSCERMAVAAARR
jgi:hypothetical protein